MQARRALSRTALLLLLAGTGWLLTCQRGNAAPVAEFPTHLTGARLALVFTGDDGTTSAIQTLATRLAARGIPSVVIASSETPDTPIATGREIDQLVRAHLATWHRERLLLVGTGRGAGLLPFVANRIGHDLRDRVDAIVLVDLPERVSFRRRWKRPWRVTPRPTDLPILPELERMRGTPLLCLYERDDRNAFCPTLDSALATRDVASTHDPWIADGDQLAHRVLAFAH